MPTRILFVNHSVPHCFHGGGGVTAYSIVLALLQADIEVHLLCLESSDLNGNSKEDFHINHLKKDLCVEVYFADRKLRPKGRKRLPLFKDHFAYLEYHKEVKKVFSKIRADAIIGYHWEVLSSFFMIKDIPILGLVGDPIHLPDLFRSAFKKKYGTKVSWSKCLRSKFFGGMNLKVQKSGMVRLLNNCSISGAFAAHHARELSEMGASNCRYFHTPTPNPLNLKKVRSGKFKILHIGHLRGIATLAGLELLAFEILPYLKNHIGSDNFEIHLVGGFFESLPEKIRQKLTDPSVLVRGQINPPDEEFLSSNVVIVPTPIELGIRVRIITALSFGSCIIAHEANKRGIPELENGKNCLLGTSGTKIAKLTERVFNDACLQDSLELSARNSYEKHFSIEQSKTELSNSVNYAIAIRK